MATRTIANGGGSWATTGTWVEGIVPILGDAVVCTASSGQLTIGAAAACTSIDFTSYTNTLTLNATLTVSGNVTLVAAMTITTSAGTPILSVNATGTLTSNTKAFPYTLDLRGTSQTYTLADNWSVLNLTTNNAVTQSTINGNILTVTQNLTTGPALGNTLGTTTVNLTGTGTWTYANYSGFGCSLIIAAGSGTITLSGSTQIVFTGANFTYTSGTFNFVVGQVWEFLSNCTINSGSLVFTSSYVFFTGAYTFTLLSDFICTNLTWAGNTVINGNNVRINGNFLPVNNCHLTGTATFILQGTGTWGSTQNTSYQVHDVNIIINTTGTITIAAANVDFGNAGTLTYTTAASVITTGSTLRIGVWSAGTTTLNTNGITWANISNLLNSTLNLTSNLTLSGTLTTTANLTFTGTGVFSTANLTCITAGVTITLVAAQTYTVTGVLTLTGTSGSHVVIKSSVGGSRAILTMSNAVSSYVIYTNATDIDSSAGSRVYDFTGTLSNDLNWVGLPLKTIAY